MDYYINQEIVLPDGYTAIILLCAGRYVTVWLTNANRLTREQRLRSYLKSELEGSYE